MKSIESLNKLLKDFKALPFENEEASITADVKNYSQLLDRYTILSKECSANQKKKASDFNIFKLLKLQRNETRTHSPFLSHLLNPNGTHAQGTLFYDLFIWEVEKAGLLNARKKLSISNPYDITITQEKYTGNGSIDIFIKGPHFIIVIENKIYAPDQDQQLKRYLDYCRRSYHIPFENIFLIYLTLNGRKPSEASLGLKDAEVEAQLICMSYYEHIASFLTNSRHLCASANVRHVIWQYYNTITEL